MVSITRVSYNDDQWKPLSDSLMKSLDHGLHSESTVASTVWSPLWYIHCDHCVICIMVWIDKLWSVAIRVHQNPSEWWMAGAIKSLEVLKSSRSPAGEPFFTNNSRSRKTSQSDFYEHRATFSQSTLKVPLEPLEARKAIFVKSNQKYHNSWIANRYSRKELIFFF